MDVQVHNARPVLQNSISLDLDKAQQQGKKKDYHFSDFSLYPDRYTAPPKSKSEAIDISKSGGQLLEPPKEASGGRHPALSTSVSNPVGLSSRVG